MAPEHPMCVWGGTGGGRTGTTAVLRRGLRPGPMGTMCELSEDRTVPEPGCSEPQQGTDGRGRQARWRGLAGSQQHPLPHPGVLQLPPSRTMSASGLRVSKEQTDPQVEETGCGRPRPNAAGGRGFSASPSSRLRAHRAPSFRGCLVTGRRALAKRSTPF